MLKATLAAIIIFGSVDIASEIYMVNHPEPAPIMLKTDPRIQMRDENIAIDSIYKCKRFNRGPHDPDITCNGMKMEIERVDY